MAEKGDTSTVWHKLMAVIIARKKMWNIKLEPIKRASIRQKNQDGCGDLACKQAPTLLEAGIKSPHFWWLHVLLHKSEGRNAFYKKGIVHLLPYLWIPHSSLWPGIHLSGNPESSPDLHTTRQAQSIVSYTFTLRLHISFLCTLGGVKSNKSPLKYLRISCQ